MSNRCTIPISTFIFNTQKRMENKDMISVDTMVKDIRVNECLNHSIKSIIDKYTNLKEAGKSVKSIPAVILLKQDNLNANYLLEQFCLILVKKCTLPRTIRDFIQEIVVSAMTTVFNQYYRNGSEEESRG